MRRMNPPLIAGGFAADSGRLTDVHALGFARDLLRSAVKKPRKASARTSPPSSTMNTSAKRVRGA
jgi:hypothetical protein